MSTHVLLPIGRTSACTTQHRRGRAGHLHAPALSQLTSFCPAPSKHLGKPANGSPGREDQRGGAPGPACSHGSGAEVTESSTNKQHHLSITGQVRVRAMQAGQTRTGVVRAHTHTSTRAQRCLRSVHTQLAQLPSYNSLPVVCLVQASARALACTRHTPGRLARDTHLQ